MSARASTVFPFGDFLYLQHQLDQLTQDAFGLRQQASVTTLPFDVFDRDEQLVIQAYVPGIRAEHLDVQLEDGVVTIRGQFPRLYDAETSQGHTWYARELRGGRFQRAITLPYMVAWDAATAEVVDGVLRLVLPKAAEAKPRRLTITDRSQGASTPELTASTRQNGA